jgi:DNA-binding LacI/PurR family transcriptional regulator
MTTIADVAREAGVSLSTVSRAFSAPDLVNPRTRERVRAVARRMGYEPNRIARSLVLGRTSTIGLIVPDIANPFFPPIIKAVQARARRKDRAVLVADTDEHAEDEVELARVMAKQVDGLIVVSPRTPEPRLGELGGFAPTVFVNRKVPGAASVIIDNADGLRRAVQLLRALGHTRIAYLAGPRNSWSNRQRRAAVRAESRALGLEFVEYGPFEPQIQAGVGAADLLHGSGITAIIAYDDMIALGVLTRLGQRGLRAGRDVSVIGIDDSPLAAIVHPTLTSVHVPGYQAGTAAVDLLLNLLHDPERTDVVELETRLVVRDSTGPAPHGPA